MHPEVFYLAFCERSLGKTRSDALLGRFKARQGFARRTFPRRRKSASSNGWRRRRIAAPNAHCADAAFAKPDLHEVLEEREVRKVIRFLGTTICSGALRSC